MIIQIYINLYYLNKLNYTPSFDNLRNILINDLDEVKEEPFIKKIN
jgi:hypothetical protein